MFVGGSCDKQYETFDHLQSHVGCRCCFYDPGIDAGSGYLRYAHDRRPDADSLREALWHKISSDHLRGNRIAFADAGVGCGTVAAVRGVSGLVSGRKTVAAEDQIEDPSGFGEVGCIQRSGGCYGMGLDDASGSGEHGAMVCLAPVGSGEYTFLLYDFVMPRFEIVMERYLGRIIGK